MFGIMFNIMFGIMFNIMFNIMFAIMFNIMFNIMIISHDKNTLIFPPNMLKCTYKQISPSKTVHFI